MPTIQQMTALRNQTPPIPVAILRPEELNEWGWSKRMADTADTAADRDASDMAAAFDPSAAYRSDRDRLIDGEWGPGVADSLDLMGVLIEREAGVLGRAGR